MRDILEVSISRIEQHLKNDEFVIISAWRQTDRLTAHDVPRHVNVNNTNKLLHAIRGEGLGYTRIEGFGQETDPDTGHIRPSREASFLVVNKRADGTPHPDFLNKMFELAEHAGPHYAQEFLAYHEPSHGAIIYNVSTRQPDMSFSRTARGPGTSGFHSMLHNRSIIRAQWKDKEPHVQAQEFRQAILRGVRDIALGRTAPSKERSFHFESLIAQIIAGRDPSTLIEKGG